MRARVRTSHHDASGETVVAGGDDEGMRGPGKREPEYKLCPLSVKSRLSLLSGLIFMSVYRGNRYLNERRCP